MAMIDVNDVVEVITKYLESDEIRRIDIKPCH
jgi:hypothetical protein